MLSRDLMNKDNARLEISLSIGCCVRCSRLMIEATTRETWRSTGRGASSGAAQAGTAQPAAKRATETNPTQRRGVERMRDILFQVRGGEFCPERKENNQPTDGHSPPAEDRNTTGKAGTFLFPGFYRGQRLRTT